MKHDIRQGTCSVRPIHRSGRCILLGSVFLGALAIGAMATPQEASAQCAITTSASPLTFTATNQTLSLTPTAVQACDQYIDDSSKWGGLFTTSTGDAYNYYGIGVNPYTAAPLAQEFVTNNATYELSGDLSTDAYTVKLISLKPGASPLETLTFYTCATAEAPANANGCPTTQAATIAVKLDFPAPDITTTSLSNATAGASYSQTIAATSNFASINFTVISGSLPDGLTLSTSGVISGTPTEQGVFNLTVRATDQLNKTDDQALTLTVDAAVLSLTPTSLPNPQVGTAYSQSLTTSGGTAPYSYSHTGSLPNGLTLGTDGVLTGTATASGSFNFSVTTTDSTGGGASTKTENYQLDLAVPTLTMPTTLADATVGANYSATVAATGGTAPYTYSVTPGSLPAGVSLSSGGALSGTPTAGGTFNFAITATDSTGGTAASRSFNFSLIVAAPTITLTPTSLTNANRGDVISIPLSAIGGTSSYTYSHTGSLPEGISLSPSGQLSGTLNASGSFNFTVTAQDASTGTGPYSGSQAYSWTIAPPSLSLPALPNGNVNGSYDSPLTVTGGTGPYSLTVETGALPPGLRIENGRLVGTPTTLGSYSFSIKATDSSTHGGPYSVSQAYTIDISAPLVILPSANLSDGEVGQTYSASLPTPTGGSAPYSYSAPLGLPPGLSLSSSGTISGKPTLAGTYSFQVTVTTAGQTATQTYSITIAAAPPIPIPTLSEWAMILMSLMMAGAGALRLIFRRTA